MPPLDLAVVPLKTFANLVQGPAALTRALSHILLLPEGADGNLHQGNLTPGQILVSREGAVWRWDGYTVRAGAASEAAVRLKQRNRLAELERERNTTREAATAARELRVTAEAAERAARAAETHVRDTRRAAEATARDARRAAEQRFDRSRSEAIRLTAEAERAGARAVSYTHLDVYKRQVQQAPGVSAPKPRAAAMAPVAPPADLPEGPLGEALAKLYQGIQTRR